MFGQLRVQVQGPASRTLGRIEAVPQKEIYIDAKDFFSGLDVPFIAFT